MIGTRISISTFIAIVLAGLVALFLFSGCGTLRGPATAGTSATSIITLDTPQAPPGLAKVPFLAPSDNPLELDYRRMSVWLFLAGLVALFFRHNWGAGCAFAGAIIGPLVGRLADSILALSTYFLFSGMALAFVVAWHLLKDRLSLPDDGTILSSFLARFKRKPPYPLS
jgi:hypothetical protein